MLDYATLPTEGQEEPIRVRKTTLDWFNNNVSRSKQGIFSEVAIIDPEIARLMLLGNEANRAVSSAHVRRLASDMKGGNWALNGESIKIAVDGRLADGQNRCFAVIMANVAVKMLVTWGVDYETRVTTDQGRAKGVGDYLAMAHSTPNSACAAAVARIVLAERLNVVLSYDGRSNLTKSRIYKEYEDRKEEIDSAVATVLGISKKKAFGGPSVAAASLVFLRREVPARADEFIQKFLLGTDLAAGDPILSARDRMIRDPHMNVRERLKLIRLAFNAWCMGREATRFQVRDRKKGS